MKKRTTTNLTTVETRNGIPKVTQPMGQYREDIPSNFNLKETYLKLWERFGWINFVLGVITIVTVSIIYDVPPTNTSTMTYISAIPFVLMETPYNYIMRNWLWFVVDVLCLLLITYNVCM